MPDYSQEPFVYDYLHTTIRYENDGTGTQENRARIHVQTQAGLAQAGQLIFPYNAENETSEIRSVRVIKQDGTVIVAGPENIQDLSAPVAREAPMYTDARQKHVTVPSLSVGDFVEYDEVKNYKPLSPGQFWQTVPFQANAFCLDMQVDLNVPSGRQLKLKSPDGVEPLIKESGGRRTYRWTAFNVPAPNLMELLSNFTPTVTNMLEGLRPPVLPQVAFSTFLSWSEVGQWYAGLEHDRREPTASIRTQADAIVQGKTGDIEKAQALYIWVSQNIRYVSLSFGVGRYQPHAATDVLANRYGDCKDKTTLLEALLEAEGIHANAALINSQAALDPEVPTPAQFDHVITLISIAGKTTWVDSTTGVGPFGYLLPQLRGKQALAALTAETPALRRTPEGLPFPTLYNLTLDGAMGQDGTLDAHLQLETRGDLEVLVRLLFAKLSPEQFSSAIQEILDKREHAVRGDAHISDVKVIDVSDLSNPLRAQLHLTEKFAPNARSTTSEELTGELAGDSRWQSELLAVLPGAESKRGASGKFEQIAVALGGPKVYSLSIVISAPSAKVFAAQKPAQVHLTNQYAEYESSIAWDGTTLRANWRLNLRVPEVPQRDAGDYAAFCQKVVQSFTFSSSDKSSVPASNSGPSAASPPLAGSTKPVFIAPSEAQTFFQQGQEQSKRQDWANAIHDFESALKIAPEFPDAWREMGRAEMYHRDYVAAGTAFRKYLELAPDNRLAYLNMAWALYEQKKFTEEVDLLTKRVAGVPDDGDAYARLGAAYLALHQPERAVPALEQAVNLLPKYAFAQYTLGRAYLETHQNDKAASAFQRAVVLDDSDSRLNDAAYLLASHDSSLDIAEGWATRAVNVVEVELNGITLDSTQPQSSTLAGKAAMYWDTLGWIKFQKGELPVAEKYVFAALQLADDSTIAYHLGRIYEAQGHNDKAIELYSETLAIAKADTDKTDDEKDAAIRLASLLGGQALVQQRVEQSRVTEHDFRTIQIPNSAGVQGIGQYSLLIGPDSKALDIQSLIPDDALAGLTDALRATVMPQSFPDAAITKIPRIGTLVCATAAQPCTFTLLSSTAASRMLPSASQ
ncbi:MAG: DUF3857 domain-containing protein [Candidatus Acidiferrales bacterium]